MKLLHGDCLELMKDIPDGSVDMVLCDLPYGMTRNSWDVRIHFEPLWEQYRRVCKENAAICLFAQMPFAAELVMSNRKMYRYEWILKKSNPSGFLNAKRMPLKGHDAVQVFYRRQPIYNPQMRAGYPKIKARKMGRCSHNYGKYSGEHIYHSDGQRYPDGFIEWSMHIGGSDRGLHPTQKPVSICEYLIRTYTNEGDTVLDNCMGSGSTGVACINTGRDFIGIELDPGYFEAAKHRIEEAQQNR